MLSVRSAQLLFLQLTHKWKEQVINIMKLMDFQGPREGREGSYRKSQSSVWVNLNTGFLTLCRRESRMSTPMEEG